MGPGSPRLMRMHQSSLRRCKGQGFSSKPWKRRPARAQRSMCCPMRGAVRRSIWLLFLFIGSFFVSSINAKPRFRRGFHSDRFTRSSCPPAPVQGPSVAFTYLQLALHGHIDGPPAGWVACRHELFFRKGRRRVIPLRSLSSRAHRLRCGSPPLMNPSSAVPTAIVRRCRRSR